MGGEGLEGVAGAAPEDLPAAHRQGGRPQQGVGEEEVREGGEEDRQG